nr:ADP-ribosylglycohydrolase family protein [Clostridia bacterium]
ACELAGRDGQLDHYSESVWAEKFMAALESMAFFEDDIEVLIKDALSLIPADSKFRIMAEYTASLCRKYGDIKVVLTKVMFEYGHPDCTNMYQNMAIVIASLLLGGLDIIKTGMLALNCGFDTDCTCASAGSIIGILRGADDLKRAYELDEVTYTLGVRSNRRSDKVYDLAEDIARLAVIFAKQKSTDVIIEGAPDFEPDFESLPDFTLRTDYADMNPSIAPGGECSVVLNITNNTDADAVLDCEISSESNIHCEMPCFKVSVGAHGSAAIPIRFTLDKYCESVSDKNIFTLSANSAVIGDFGICGASAWKLSGPFWRTEPVITTQKILDNIEAKFPYSKYIKESCVKGCGMDRLRHFHLNFHADTETEFMTEEELFKAASDGFASSTHEEKAVFIANDSFTMDELFSFKGPCTAYLSRIIEAPRDMTVFAQVGYSSPFALYVNGELIASRDDCNTWTAENVHLEGIKFKEGENRIVLRMTRVNADAKYNIYFSRGIATAEIHLLTSKNPYRF